MNILFVCKHNRFRSKVAEVIFRKLNKNNNAEVKSAGVQIDLLRPYVCENVKKVMREKGYEIVNEQARMINDTDLEWADKIIIVANNVDPRLFKARSRARVEVWKISDADEQDYEKIKRLVGKIEKSISRCCL